MGVKLTKEEILEYHLVGKLSLAPTKELNDQKGLSIAYTPGVAQVCKEIEANPEAAEDFTAKSNLVAVATDGTAVLGLGNIGALASIPVMEGKCVLFKAFAKVNAWPICMDYRKDGKTDAQKVIDHVKAEACFYG